MTSSPAVTRSTGTGSPIPRRRSWSALGGVGAQGTQALASLALQVLAARLLGVEGLGLFAAIYAVVVMATAVTSGFVGDSLTVLDRHRPQIRSSLQGYWVGMSAGLGLVVGVGAWGTGLVDGPTALACGLATSCFLCEDAIRRLLMASMRFWHIVVTDLVVLGVSVTWILGVHWGGGVVDLAQIFLAMALGQASGTVVGIRLLPRDERWLAPWRGAEWRVVTRYGGWRALQQVVRPTMLAGARVAAITLASLAAAGELEAARIYMAPAMIVVGGVSTFLFASYAIDRTSQGRQQLRRVDRNVLVLVGGVALLCLAAVVSMPWVGPLLTGGGYELSALAVVGWAAYAAATAMSTPYGQLAAVRGQHVGAFVIRAVDASVSLAAVAVLLVAGMDVALVPVVLAAGSVAGGAAMRWLVVRGARSADEVHAAGRPT